MMQMTGADLIVKLLERQGINTIAGTGTNSGNTFPQYYDTLGRYYTLGLTMRF